MEDLALMAVAPKASARPLHQLRKPCAQVHAKKRSLDRRASFGALNLVVGQDTLVAMRTPGAGWIVNRDVSSVREKVT